MRIDADGIASTTASSLSSMSPATAGHEMPNLDRIFVNKWIKQRLCQTATGNRAWLRNSWSGSVTTRISTSGVYCRPAAHEVPATGPAITGTAAGEPLDLCSPVRR